MLGFSIYLYDKPDKNYIKSMYDKGFKEIFTSIHIPEYAFEHTWQHIESLGEICLEFGLQLTVDLSQDMVKKLPVEIGELKRLGITGLRLDDGFSMQDVSFFTQNYKVALNASTVSANDLQLLKELAIDFTNVEAWHNYYPRQYTGLDEAYFKEQNQLFKEANIQVAAFVMGDDVLRAPMFEGLPTLEKHRNQAVLANAIELVDDYFVNKVFIGDPRISDFASRQLQHYFVEQTLLLRVEMTQSFNPLFERTYHNRPEVARDVIRIVESRSLFAKHHLTGEAVNRQIGAVTINLPILERYAGEIQLIKNELPLDPFVITIGLVIDGDIALLKKCKGSQCIRMEEFTHGFREINDRKKK